MRRYNHYFRIGDFDTWISSDDQFRAEKFIDGDVGYKVYTATFVSTEEKSANLLTNGLQF